MRVFVTGASGFVGSHLVRRLRERGDAVTGADREVDVTRRDVLDEAIGAARPEAIVHLAALSSVADSWRDPEGVFRVNFLGTRTLLRSVERCVPAARLLAIGSADAYGAGPPGTPPLAEREPLAPRSPYARAKAAAELLAAEAAERGLDVVRVRPFNHTGAGQSDAFVASSFARQVAEIAAGLRPPRMRVGNLASVREFLDVHDVVEAYVALLDRDVPPRVFNVARGEGVPVRRLLELLLGIAGVDPEIEVDPERLRPTDALVGDPSRLRAATGWEAKTPLRATLASLLRSWQSRINGR